MAQNAYVETYGCSFVYGTAGGSPATALAVSLKAIRGLPGSKADKFEITRIDQANRMKQWVSSMIDTGQLQVTLGMSKTDYATLLGFVGVLKSWKVLFSQASTDVFDGFIESLVPKSEGANGEVVVDMDITASGARTFTA